MFNLMEKSSKFCSILTLIFITFQPVDINELKLCTFKEEALNTIF